MKVKEVDRTANIAWSPAPQVPIYLAAGTAAQQLDATFSTSSCLEIYSLNLAETGHDMPCVASLPVEQRFHKVAWGAAGMQDNTMLSGLIVGGADRGVVSMYDAKKLIKGENALIFSQDKHTGPVAALDFNPFQHNLLASGGSESELYIWDVNKLTSPMTPGAKSQPLDDIRCVAWNRQVQHILASTFASRCVVWDLRKNDPIIKVSDSTSRMRCKVVAWHPEVATQLCLASEDDHMPVIQIWDLRLASSPLKTLEGHEKGVLSVAWCKDDSDLLLSCGKDNRILVWNPNSPQGEIVAELPTSHQWSFEVSWCPRNPAIIASASFDGHVSLYGLMGGQQQAEPNSRITDSFGPGSAIQQQAAPQVRSQLKTPPKWLRRPCGASFGFGGKLVTFEAEAPGSRRHVYLSRVVTETELVDRSVKLETSLEAGNLVEFCNSKVSSLQPNSQEARLWSFIAASFSTDTPREYIRLLGLDLEAVESRLGRLLKPAANRGKQPAEQLLADLSLEGPAGDDHNLDDFELIAMTAEEAKTLPTALDSSFKLDLSEGSGEGDLSLALLTGNMDLAVELAVQQAKWADALILAAQGGETLLRKTQALYFQRGSAGGGTAALLEAVAMDGWERLVANCELDSWQEVLAALVVYCDQTRRLSLAGQLARWLGAGGPDYRSASTLASIVAADLEAVVENWVEDVTAPGHLQDMVEVVVMLRAAVQAQGIAANLSSGSRLSTSLARYASLLAGQGCLSSALVYLGETAGADPALQELKERLERALAGPPPSRTGPTVRAGSVAGAAVTSSFRRQSFQPLERKVSDPYQQQQQFNTGLPAAPTPFNTTTYAHPAYGVPASAPVPSFGVPAPAAQPAYGVSAPAAQPAYSVPPTSAYGGYQPTPAPEPVATFAPAAPPALPPASSAQSPPSGGGGNPLLRRGRAVDPSIAAPGGGNYSGGYGGYGYAAAPAAAPYNSGGFVPPEQQLYNLAGSAPANIFTPEPLGGNLGAMMPAQDFPARSRTTSQSSTGGLQPPALPPVGAFQHTPDHGGPGHTPSTSSGPAWNDPPPFMTRPAAAQPVVTDSGFTQPITHPLIGSAPAAPTPEPTPGWAGFTPAFQHQEVVAPAPAPTQPAAVVAPVAAAPRPIPSEHQCIQDVLETLKARCLQAAGHPQTRRKLEDVSSKLEILYRKLGDEVLSPNTLQGLHTILHHIRQYDYQSCLQVISALIAGGSFAELADFMPGVKMLLQVAHQAGVYIEQQQH